MSGCCNCMNEHYTFSADSRFFCGFLFQKRQTYWWFKHATCLLRGNACSHILIIASLLMALLVKPCCQVTESYEYPCIIQCLTTSLILLQEKFVRKPAAMKDIFFSHFQTDLWHWFPDKKLSIRDWSGGWLAKAHEIKHHNPSQHWKSNWEKHQRYLFKLPLNGFMVLLCRLFFSLI